MWCKLTSSFRPKNISLSFTSVDTCYLSQASADACFPSWTESKYGNRAVVCGSPNEVANNPLGANTFSFPYNANFEYTDRQKSDVWNMIALSKDDQLRQRMAWALSQILVVTPSQVREKYIQSFIFQ